MKATLLGRITTRIGGALDGALLGAARARMARSTPGDPDRARRLEEATAFYRQPALLDGDAFFPEPPRAAPREHRVRTLGDGEVVDLTFPSRWEPRWEPMRRDVLASPENATVHVRMFRHTRPAPSLVCLHGYAGGSFLVEEVSFIARALHRAGLDVSLFVLPLHGPRAAKSGAPVWPSPHVARTNEGFAQAMHDLRAYVRWLRGRGAPSVSGCGFSLGGYTAALLATLEPLDLAAMMIPVASFADLFWHHGSGRPERAAAERDGITLAHLRAAMEIVTPVARRPVTPPERCLVIDAEGDRIAPREHAARLAEHFNARRVSFAGGHILLERSPLFRTITRQMRDLGLLPRRAA